MLKVKLVFTDQAFSTAKAIGIPSDFEFDAQHPLVIGDTLQFHGFPACYKVTGRHYILRELPEPTTLCVFLEPTRDPLSV